MTEYKNVYWIYLNVKSYVYISKMYIEYIYILESYICKQTDIWKNKLKRIRKYIKGNSVYTEMLDTCWVFHYTFLFSNFFTLNIESS